MKIPHTATTLLVILSLSNAEGVNSLNGNFVWFSDVHYDAYYGTPLAKVHMTGAPCNLGDESPVYSAYGCGTSLALLESTISRASKAVKDDLGLNRPDFILYTGDSTRHSSDGLPLPITEVVENAYNTTVHLFEKNFPDVPVVQLPAPDLGNNDLPGHYELEVTSSDPCFPQADGSPPPATNQFLIDMATWNKNLFVDEMEEGVFACGGYVNRQVLPNLNIISLNTVLYSLYLAPEYNGTDPFGQFAWLKAQLENARSNETKVYITGHIPGMLQSYTGSLGEPLVKTEYHVQYTNLVLEYQDVIAAQLFGHVHSNEIRALEGFPDDAPPMIVSGSIAPGYTTTPFFSIVSYDFEETMHPKDLVTFNLDLAKYNQTKIIIPESDIWERMFDSLTSHLGMKALTNSETRKLASRFVSGEGSIEFDAYFNKWYKGLPQTDCTSSDCIFKEACLVACGSTTSQWQSCLEGNPHGLCGLEGIEDNGGARHLRGSSSRWQ